MRVVRLFFSAEQVEGVSWLRDSARFELVMFLVFLIPGTPKDVLTYVAGLTPCRWWRVAAIATVGRIPSVVTSTLAAGFASQGNWAAAVATLVVTLALVGAGGGAYALVRRRAHRVAHVLEHGRPVRAHRRAAAPRVLLGSARGHPVGGAAGPLTGARRSPGRPAGCRGRARAVPGRPRGSPSRRADCRGGSRRACAPRSRPSRARATRGR